MRRLVTLAVLASLAAAPARAREAGKPERLEALEPFLARFVGSCADGFQRRTCEENVATARKELAGRPYAVRIPDAAALVQAKLDGDRFVLLVTPFVDGGGLALTHGAPAKQDAAGRPVVPLIAIQGTLPPGMMDMEFQSPFRTGAIELEITFRPEKVWSLSRKGAPGRYEGVAARFLDIQVVNARTGDVIAERKL
jgi:hypothetical protein